MNAEKASSLFSHRKFWAHRFGTATFLPTSRAEMELLGWDSCDVVIVTGDAYIDHPSFGMAIIGRLLEAQGFRVGILDQPDWTSAEPFKSLGEPNLFFGVTAGNMDSMINRYTAERRIRRNDSYTPNDEGGKRPDRSVNVYAQRCREAYKHVPIVIGGIEASLRRIAHYDYWSDKVRRSVLFDSKADILLYGNAERALVDIAHRIARRESPRDMFDVRGVALVRDAVPDDWAVADFSSIDETPVDPRVIDRTVVRIPSFEAVRDDKDLYAQASRVLHLESNPNNARPLVQRHGDKELWLTPPPVPLSTPELDGVYELPYARAPHPKYMGTRIPAWEMIRHSINIMRGCFGGCSFCSITEHEGRIIQNRSEASILREVETIAKTDDAFTGFISDLGGPTANMYRLACNDDEIQRTCRKLSCVYPTICKNLKTDHDPLIKLYRKARAISGIKRIHIASGLRYDLAVRSPTYVKELVTHHVGGYLKIAPEHTEPGPLGKMMKPGIETFDKFKQMFEMAAKKAGKEYYLIPYFIAAHPGTTDEDMMHLAVWLKRNGFRADQVQTFLPSPMSLATAMYHSERNPLAPVKRADPRRVPTAKGLRQRRLHKAFLRYHDAENWPLLREALNRLGRADLIGNGKKHLVPTWQPRGTGGRGGGASFTGESPRKGSKPGPQKFVTQGAGEGRRTSGAKFGKTTTKGPQRGEKGAKYKSGGKSRKRR